MKEKSLLFTLLITAIIAVGCNTGGSSNSNSQNNSGSGNGASENDESSIGSDDSEVELSFWNFGADYGPLIEEYTEKNPDISINVRQMEVEDHQTNLFTSLSAGGGAPDLAAIEASEIDSYIRAEDKFVNLLDLGAADLEGDYLDWAWETGSNIEGDFLLGLPADIGPTVMYYRADVFQEAGLPSEPEEVKELIQTWEDYRHAAETILNETGKKMADNFETIFKAKRDQAPEHFFNEENELIIDSSPYMKEAYDQTAQWIEEGYTDNLGMWSREWRNGIQEGSYATLLGPAWMGDIIKEYAPDESNWRIAPIPEGAGNWGGTWITIPDQTEHTEEAYEFLTWLLAPEQQMKLFKERETFPTTPAVYEDSEFTQAADDYYGGQYASDLFAEAALDVPYVYKGPHYEDVNEEILIGLNNVYYDSDSEEEWEEIIGMVERRILR